MTQSMTHNSTYLSNRNKFNAVAGFYSLSHDSFDSFKKYSDSQWFASKQELEVYKELISLPDVLIQRQVKVPIKLPTPNYDATSWKCDFLVTYAHCPRKQFLVEAKGVPTREFKQMLQYLEYFNYTDWKRLIIVAHKRFKIDTHFWTIAVHELAEYLSLQWIER